MNNSKIQIIPVNTKREWNVFVKFPYKLYKKNPNWVPYLLSDYKALLNPEKHPFYKHADVQFFLAMQNGKPAGRIAAIIDYKHIETHEEKVGFFGFFECIESFDTARMLLDEARKWLKSKGMAYMRGPLNPSQNEECGLLIDAFDSSPMIMMSYNPPYYIDFLEKYGLDKAMDLFAYSLDGTHDPPEKLVRIADKVRKKERITVRPINMKQYDVDTKKVIQVYNHAWQKNWGFVPFTNDEFDYLAKKMKSAIDPDLVLIAEVDGIPVGFSISLPDVNQALIKTNGRLFPFGLFKLLYYAKKIKQIRIMILGIIPAYQRKGIDGILYLDTWRNATQKGYTTGEMSWILETNEMMNRAARMLTGQVYKTYRIYQMPI